MQQVSVFAENQRGMMEKITGVLRSEDINILGSVTNDSAEYGIVRMVVSNPSAAVDALTKAGLLCHLTEVVGVELMDEVGNLNQLLQALSESNINVNYLYLSFNRETGMPIMVFHSEDIMEVKACIERIEYHRDTPQRIKSQQVRYYDQNQKRTRYKSPLSTGGNWTSPEIVLDVKLKA